MLKDAAIEIEFTEATTIALFIPKETTIGVTADGTDQIINADGIDRITVVESEAVIITTRDVTTNTTESDAFIVTANTIMFDIN